jgi:hypothetical protein
MIKAIADQERDERGERQAFERSELGQLSHQDRRQSDGPFDGARSGELIDGSLNLRGGGLMERIVCFDLLWGPVTLPGAGPVAF